MADAPSLPPASAGNAPTLPSLPMESTVVPSGHADATVLNERGIARGAAALPVCGSDETLAAKPGAPPLPAAAAGAPELVGQPFGRYRLLRQIGRGGMGVVHQAWDTELKRVVALKTLLADGADGDAERVERFLREARAAARLRHPGIVPVHDVGTLAGRHFFTMDFIEGESLEAAKARLPLRRFLEILRDVALALHAAHEAGIVHRDVKPANILLDAAGRSYVGDFGLAKEVRDDSARRRLTASGAVMGTIYYMAPEQAEGRADAVGPASDQWSLGVVLYERLAGRLPFVSGSPMGVIVEILQNEPEPPSRVAPADRRVHRDLETVCLKCLDKDPGRRYASCAALAADLGRFLEGEPIDARPVSWAARAARRGLRHRAMVAMGVVTVVLAAVLAVRLPEARRSAEASEAARRRAESERAVEQVLMRAESIWREARTVLYRPAVPIARYHAKLDAALALYGQALAQLPDYGWIHESRGRVRLQTGDLAGAEADLREAARLLGPERGRAARRSLGRVVLERSFERLYRREDQDKASGRGQAEALRIAALVEMDAAAGDVDWRGTEEEARSARRLAEGLSAWARERQAEAVRILAAGVEEDADEECAWALGYVTRGPDSERWLEIALRLRPRYARVIARRAWGRIEARDWPAALAGFEEALAIEPRNAVAWVNRGKVLLEGMGDVDGALASFRTAVSCDERLAAAHCSLGTALGRAGDWRAALGSFERALALDPEFVPALEYRGLTRAHLGDTAGAFEDFDAAVRVSPGTLMSRTYRSTRCRGRGDFEGAVAEARAAVEAAPESASARSLLGQNLSAKGDLDAALAEFERAVQLSADATHRAERADVRRRRGDLAGAEEDVAAALRTTPNCALAIGVRGFCRLDRGDSAGAGEDFDAALRFDPGQGPAWFGRGLIRRGQGDLAGAIADFTEALRLDPTFAPAAYQRGLAASLQGNLDRADADFGEAIRLLLRGPEVRFNRAVVRYRLGNAAGAAEDAAEALRLAPPDWPPRATAESLLRDARARAAAQEAEKK